MLAASNDKLNCLEYLITEGAEVNVQDEVRAPWPLLALCWPLAGPAAAVTGGLGGVGVGSEGGRLRACCSHRCGPWVGGARWRRCAPRRAASPAAGFRSCRPSAGR